MKQTSNFLDKIERFEELDSEYEELTSKVQYIANLQLHKSLFVGMFATFGIFIIKVSIKLMIFISKYDPHLQTESKEHSISMLNKLYKEC